ncbi:MAG: TIGR03943 family protein [Anaerolineae bacterium]|nr:TIGR03943 family protein [Anaerolineae bacterium]
MESTSQLHDHHHEHHDHDHHHNHTQEWVKTALLLGLGFYFVFNILSGNLTNYINARFAWLSYVAAVLFLLLGVVSAYSLLRRVDDHDHQHNHADHDHEHVSWAGLLIVAIPLVLGTLVPSRPLGAAAVGSDINTNAFTTTENATTFTIAPLQRNVLDWIRVFNVTDDLTTLNGQEADVAGFVYRDSSFPDNQFMVARFTISCCVADSTAVGLPVVWDEPLAEDTWVQILGRFQVEDFRGEQRPVLHPITVEQIEQPEHPYLYP